LLVLVTGFTFWPVRSFKFVGYDDPEYVTENPMVQRGPTVETLRWAFISTHASNWHPLTWLSHALDCQLYGANPGGHHVTSLLLHVVNTVLLFLILKRMTGACWRSFLVAALFALHPLHVESVAWVAERKDVLSTFFFLLTIGTYARYADRPEVQRPKSNVWYGLALVCFALGLMTKPMLVTLPFVLLLLDYWPLQRWSAAPRLPGTSQRSGADSTLELRPFGRLVLEKLPFFALAVLASAVTYNVQKGAGSVVPLDALSGAARGANVLVSYSRYLQKTIWPVGLSPFYPYVFSWPAWQVGLAGLLLVGVSLVAATMAKRRPYLLVGWLWYLGTLVPVIGLVQVGSQSIADRYTYIPLIGVFVALAWGAGDILKSTSSARLVWGTTAALILALCAASTRKQLWNWQDTETLFRHALHVDPNNEVACNNLGEEFCLQGRKEEALVLFKKAIALRPRYADLYANMGRIFFQQGKWQEAADNYQAALHINPNHVAAHIRMGQLLVGAGAIDEAISHYRTAIRLRPLHVDALNDLGIAFHKKGRLDQAVIYFQQALRLRPNYPEALNNLANVLAAQRHWDGALVNYREALRLKPEYVNARYNLGDALGKMGRSDEAVQELTEVLRRKPDDAGAHNRLGEILARQGKAKEALQSYEAALKLQPDSPDALRNQAWLLATCPDPQFRDGGEALRLARRALELTSAENIHALDALAAAYAETGQFSAAMDSAEKALAMARSSNQLETVAQIEARVALYRATKPFREP
jgi:protein O-mannosyl-transferase